MSTKPFTIDEYVRWSDVDKAGIIFYGAYVRFFEIAETELFRSAGVPYSEVFDNFNIWLPRANLNCDFTYPARLDDCLRVAAYFTRFGNSSIGINFDAVHLGAKRMAAAAHEVLVCVDRNTMKSRPLPGELRDLLQPYQLAEVQARSQLGVTLETER
ncbi:MAG: acyl-CoA thioesterase [Gemmatimonadota bacterium]|nr:MAG: acyl-CoA thioesterase [Gemmatimonadota bacterium]